MIVEELAEALGAEVVQDGPCAVARLALVLDASPAAFAWALAHGADAVLAHRWWDGGPPPEQLGLLGLHEPLDARVAPWLAEAAGLRSVGPVASQALCGLAAEDTRERVRALLGGEDRYVRGTGGRVTVAAVSARFDADTVRAVVGAGAQLLITGEWRPAAAELVAQTGLAVQLTGHARAERWALAELARRLRGEIPGLDVVLVPG